ncbi:MAG: hypothetical protein QXI45_02025 [Thermofilaceae archaeon]
MQPVSTGERARALFNVLSFLARLPEVDRNVLLSTVPGALRAWYYDRAVWIITESDIISVRFSKKRVALVADAELPLSRVQEMLENLAKSLYNYLHALRAHSNSNWVNERRRILEETKEIEENYATVLQDLAVLDENLVNDFAYVLSNLETVVELPPGAVSEEEIRRYSRILQPVVAFKAIGNYDAEIFYIPLFYGLVVKLRSREAEIEDEFREKMIISASAGTEAVKHRVYVHSPLPFNDLKWIISNKWKIVNQAVEKIEEHAEKDKSLRKNIALFKKAVEKALNPQPETQPTQEQRVQHTSLSSRIMRIFHKFMKKR